MSAGRPIRPGPASTLAGHLGATVSGIVGACRWVEGVVGTLGAILGVAGSTGFGRARTYVRWREQTATGDRAVDPGERAALIWDYARWVHRMRRTR